MSDMECNAFLRPYAAWTQHTNARGRHVFIFLDSVSQKGISCLGLSLIDLKSGTMIVSAYYYGTAV